LGLVGRAVDREAASPNQMGQFETKVLATPTALSTLAEMAGR